MSLTVRKLNELTILGHPIRFPDGTLVGIVKGLNRFPEGWYQLRIGPIEKRMEISPALALSPRNSGALNCNGHRPKHELIRPVIEN